MRFARPNGGTVEIGPAPTKVLLAHRQLTGSDAEAGGMLLGRIIRGTTDVVIDLATIPTLLDRRSRFRFFRARAPAQAEIDRVWRESEQVVNYLGEWHTHPEDHPTPSCIDRRSWKRTMSRAVFEQDFLLFMIVGLASTRVWELSRGSEVPHLLTTEPKSTINAARSFS